MKKDPARHSKLEKADILEMTVKHLENLQRQQVAMSAATDPAVLNKFRAGFSECAGEVGRFPGLDPSVKRRLLQHLANCLAGATQVKQQENQQPMVTPAPQQQAVQLHILPSPVNGGDQPNGIIFSNGNGTGVQLVPTRLPNGDIALVLPTSQAPLFRQSSPTPPQSAGPLPMLVPIPTRTASTASAASSTSSSSCSASSHGFSAPASPEPMDVAYTPEPDMHTKPLSLVIRKSYEPAEEEKPWRPW